MTEAQIKQKLAHLSAKLDQVSAERDALLEAMMRERMFGYRAIDSQRTLLDQYIRQRQPA